MSKPVYRFRIRCNATGEVREHDECYEWNDGAKDWRDGLLFQWTEGNFGCDCNRELFFRRLRDEDFDEEAVECLPSGRYTVIDVTCPDGEVIRVDDDEFSG